MKFYKETYGADADGNRGVPTIDYEIEKKDKTEICEKLYDIFLEGETTGKHNIFMYCNLIDEEIEIEIDIEEYIDDLIKMLENDNELKDEYWQEWLKELKNEKYKRINKIAEKNNLIFYEVELDEYYNEKVEKPTYMVREKAKYGLRGEYYKYIILDKNFKLFALGDEQGNYAGGICSELYPKKIELDSKNFKNFIKELENGK